MTRFVSSKTSVDDPHDVRHHVPGVHRDSHRDRSGAELPADQPAGQPGEDPAVQGGQRPHRQHRLAVLPLAAQLRHRSTGAIHQGQPSGVAGAEGSHGQHVRARHLSRPSSASTIGLGIGILSAMRPRSTFDTAATTAPSSASRSRRTSAAILLQLFFAITLTRWLGLDKPVLPTSGIYPPGHKGFDPVLRAKHLILPVTVVAIQIIAVYSPIHAGIAARGQEQRLHAHRSRQGHQRAPDPRAARACATRSSPSSRSRRSTSVPSSAASSSPSASSRTRGWATSS